MTFDVTVPVSDMMQGCETEKNAVTWKKTMFHYFILNKYCTFKIANT